MGGHAGARALSELGDSIAEVRRDDDAAVTFCECVAIVEQAVYEGQRFHWEGSMTAYLTMTGELDAHANGLLSPQRIQKDIVRRAARCDEFDPYGKALIEAATSVKNALHYLKGVATAPPQRSGARALPEVSQGEAAAARLHRFERNGARVRAAAERRDQVNLYRGVGHLQRARVEEWTTSGLQGQLGFSGGSIFYVVAYQAQDELGNSGNPGLCSSSGLSRLGVS